jgi:hypothetical protein
MTNTPGWAIELDGDQIDIDDLRYLLPAPFDPWVEDYPTDDGPKPIFRSKNWTGIREASVIYGDARRILERLHGELLLIHNDAKPVKAGRALSFGPDGKRENILYAISASVAISLGRVRMRARATTGTPVSETVVQRWFREAEGDRNRDDLFLHLTRLDNWYDLYKSMEIVRRMIGQTKLNPILGGDRKRWNDIWQTANCNRHSPDPVKYPLPVPTPTFRDAREFVLEHIAKVLKKKN